MGLAKITISIFFMVAFVLSLLMFVGNFGYDNQAEIMMGQDSDYITLNSTMASNQGTLYNDAVSSSNALASSTIDSSDQATKTGGQFKGGVNTARKVLGDSLTIGFKKIFGEDSGFGIILTLLTSCLMIIIGFYTYKAWVGRDPD